MLPKQRRIPRDLFGLLKKAKTFSNSIFFAKLAKYDGKQSRFSVSVSKKVAKKAVLRNKMRRLGYRILGENIEKINKPILLQISWIKNANQREVEAAIRDIITKIQ
ncbi:MAG: ribonuclease P protein component [Patescibacteria group bacterium]